MNALSPLLRLPKLALRNAREAALFVVALAAYIRYRGVRRKAFVSTQKVVAYDGTLLTRTFEGRATLTGVERYLIDLVSELVHGGRFTPRIYMIRPFSIPGLRESLPLNSQVQSGHSVRWIWRLSADLTQHRAAIYHVHHAEVPLPHLLPLAFALVSVVTIHDIIPLHFGYLKLHRALIFKVILRWLSRRADVVIFDSEYSRNDFRQMFHVPVERTRVVPLGISDRFRPVGVAGEGEKLRRTYSLPDRFVLAVGRAAPHKNLLFLISVIAKLRERGHALQLVIAGPRDNTAAQRDLDAAIAAAHSQAWIIRTGQIDDDDLPALYRATEVLAFPSLVEGFGLPILEAMACGCPIVCSNRASVPEVAGQAALLADPTNAQEFAGALERILTDPTLRADLRQKGIAHAARFTPHETARRTQEIYAEALNAKGRNIADGSLRTKQL